MPNNSNRTTNFGPRVSFTTTKADSGPVHVYGDSNSTFQWDGPVQFGANGSQIAGIFTSTFSVDLQSVPANDSVSTTATLTELTADSIVLSVQPASIWSGAYLDLSLGYQVSAASTLVISAVNSTITAVDPDAMNFTAVWLDPA